MKPKTSHSTTTSSSELGKLPPQAIELEEAILAACMLERNAYDNITNILKPESFYKDQHQTIFKTISNIRMSGNPIDILTVTDQLKKEGKLDEVGGPVYITQLSTKVAAATHIQYHARIVAQKYIQREVIRSASTLQGAAFDEDFDQVEATYSQMTRQIDLLMAGKSGIRHVKDIAFDSSQALEERSKKGDNEMTGIPTGLNALNRITTGWQGGQLIVLAARPAMGKTAIALNLFTKAAAIHQKHVAFFSLEMTDVSLFDRLVLSWGGISKDNFKRGKLTDEEFDNLNQAYAEISGMPIYIDDNHNININYLRAVIRSIVRKGECDMAVIDYLQLVDSMEDSKYMNREREVAIITRSLKMIAKEMNIPIVLLCQMNRDAERRSGWDKKPRLSDLRESGSIEQDADIVIMPWRPEYYGLNEGDNGEDMTNILLLEITKHRDGATGEIACKKNTEFTVITDFNKNPF